jgi:Na+/proline symporter
MLMIKLFPQGVLGLGLAAVFGVIISSGNTMNVVAAATIFKDLLRRSTIRNEKRGLLESRLITFGIGIAGLSFALSFPSIVQLVLNAFYMIAILFPALCGAVLWERATKTAANLSIACGGIITLVLIPIIPKQAFVPGAITAILLLVLVSYLTQHSNTENISFFKSLRN